MVFGFCEKNCNVMSVINTLYFYCYMALCVMRLACCVEFSARKNYKNQRDPIVPCSEAQFVIRQDTETT